MSGLSGPPDWYKDAVVYEVGVRSFCDSDGDGYGDLKGLVSKLDYLADLGVTALWLLPLCPSPMRDDGYDIADYKGIHPQVGTLDDFRALIEAAHARGLRVITELVLNHTSDQHPWFQRARRAPKGHPDRDWYVWSDDPERYKGARVIFQDFEKTNWTWDADAKAYYWHRFYHHQPDLNFEHAPVREAILDVVDHWFGLGVDGLRLDAVPYLYEREGTSSENLPETHAFLKTLRAHVDAKWTGRMLLAEANQWPEDAVKYFGDGDECHMAFHFPLMPRLFMAMRREERRPIAEIMARTPAIPDNCQWALFLRNHDELTLEMVTDEERDYLWREYAKDPKARLNLGIRRRLAPLLDGDRRRMEMMTAMLLSLPGTPVLYYGDEIGMGDNLGLGDRNGVRTPMQWSPDRNAGFSTADASKLVQPLVTDPAYHWQTFNVELQKANESSFLNWTRRLLRLRARHPAFGRGSVTFVDAGTYHALAFVREFEGDRVLVACNLSRFTRPLPLDLSRWKGATPVELFGGVRFPPVADDRYQLTLGPRGFCWFALEGP
ncbi:MAG: maltose alpha-D-glucosyltransferase [Elusimicrobia bacterium]|nr:maltose alpha-D-glucosyltransferase [Elusimicrobiota bacterium]